MTTSDSNNPYIILKFLSQESYKDAVTICADHSCKAKIWNELKTHKSIISSSEQLTVEEFNLDDYETHDDWKKNLCKAKINTDIIYNIELNTWMSILYKIGYKLQTMTSVGIDNDLVMVFVEKHL